MPVRVPDDDRIAFHHFIQITLSKHPEWLDAAINGISSGMAMALHAANLRAGKADIAMRSALALANSGRLTPQAKAALNRSISEAINREHACETERQWMEQNEKQPKE